MSHFSSTISSADRGCTRLPDTVYLHSAAFAAWATAMLLGIAGCGEPGQRASSKPTTSSQIAREQANNQAELFGLLAENLNRLEEFDNSQTQIRDRLNHWARQDRREATWKPDPLVETLPSELAELADHKRLDQNDYSLEDIAFIQQAVWLRDISKQVRVGKFEEIDVAERLFDWTIRQIQLEPDDYGKTPHLPQEILLLGRGTSLQRAWIFALLARQQQLDVVLVKVQKAEGDAPPRYLAALFSQNQLYLFDPELGLPVPGPNGKGIATLNDAASDDAVLRQLDLDAEHPYPLHAADLDKVTVLVEAGPKYLSRRMRAIESRLSGKLKVVLTAMPSELEAKVGKLAHVEAVKLWTEPFFVEQRKAALDQLGQQASLRELVIFSPQLPVRKGRALQFKGEFDGPKGAKQHFLAARLSKQQLDNIEAHPEWVLGSKENVAKFKPEAVDRIIRQEIEVREIAKQCSSLWLGLIAFEQQKYDVATDFFFERTLKENPNGPWTAAARYNLARTYEASGAIDKAIALYASDKTPQSHGNRLRAKRLQTPAATPEEKQSAETPPAEPTPPKPAEANEGGK